MHTSNITIVMGFKKQKGIMQAKQSQNRHWGKFANKNLF